MVPSGLCETYFYLLSKDLGNLRQRALPNDIYHVLVTNLAFSGQPPFAPGLAWGWGLPLLSLAPPGGSCGGGDSMSGWRGAERRQSQA